VEEYVQAQRVNAERPESHLNLGLIAVAAGDAQAAEDEYTTALRLDATFTPAYVNLSDLYRQLGRDAAGEDLLRAGIKATDGNADLQHALGLLLVRQKRLDEALTYLGQAAALAKDNPRYAYVYAVALQEAGDTQRALDVLTKASERHPGNRDIVDALTALRQQQDAGSKSPEK
jgi:tetratricopeptide (TPR) repeat protein